MSDVGIKAADEAPSGEGAPRPLRRDAQRNRQRIVAAARGLIATHGLGVSYEEIARVADVAVGTVYNRFPRREDLVDVVFTEQVEDVVDVARRALAVVDPWDALVEFMTGNLELQATNRGLRELGSGTSHHAGLADHARQRIAPLTGQLLERAQDAEVVRRDVTDADLALVPIMVGAVMDTVRGVGGERRVDEDLWRRALALVMEGLRAHPGRALPGRTPSTEQFNDMLGVKAPRPPEQEPRQRAQP